MTRCVFHNFRCFESFVQTAIPNVSEVWVEGYSTVDEVLDDIVTSHQIGIKSIIGFEWPASQFDHLS